MNNNQSQPQSDPELSSMYSPVSDEEAMRQSNVNKKIETITDILKSDVPRLNWEEGDNWMRFLNPFQNPWNIPIQYYEMRQGDRVARVIRPDFFNEPDLFKAAQIELYMEPKTRPLMWDKEHPKNFHFQDHRKAVLVASRWENTLSPFGVVLVTLGREPRRDAKYKEAWGDALIKLPLEMDVDPLQTETTTPPKAKWGKIFDAAEGRLIKCSFANLGTKDITASFMPHEKAMPLGKYETVAGQPKPVFVPLPQFREILRTAPNVKQSLTRITVDMQKELIRMFVTPEMLPIAERGIQKELSGENRNRYRSQSTAAPKPAPTAVAEASIPVPEEEPTELGETDKLYVDFVAALGPKFAEVGEATVRKLIQLGMVNPNNIKMMAGFATDMLKSIATAGK